MNKTWFQMAAMVGSFCSTVVWAAAPQDLSHTSVVKNADGSILHVIKSYVRDGDKLRVEYLSAEGAVNAIGIYRRDKGLVWGVEPDTKTYTQKKMSAGDWESSLFSVFPEPGQTLKKTGEAPCRNYSCDIVTSDLGELSTVNTIVRDMNVIMKSDWVQNGEVVQSSETTEFNMGKPPAELFDLPSGYKRREIVQ